MQKTSFRRHIIVSYLFAVLTAAAVMGLSGLIRQPPRPSTVLDGPWRFSSGEGELGIYQVPFYRSAPDRSGFSQGVYEAAISFETEEHYAQPVLVLPYTNANALRLTLNGKLFGSFGDMKEGRTSRWNAPHLFAVPPELLAEGSNTLTVELYGLYEAGIHAPPYLAERKTAAGHFLLLSHLNHLLIAYALGAVALLALLFTLTSRLIDHGQRERVLIALALLGLAVYLSDYLLLETLVVPYHIYKRIALFGLYCALTFSIPGLYGYTQRRLDPPAYAAMSLSAAAALAVLIMPRNIFEVRAIYSYANLCFLPTIAVLHYALIPRLKRDRRSFWILMGLTVLSLLALRDVLVVLFGSGRPILTHYGIIALAVSFSLALIGEMLEYYRRMVSMKQWADTVYQESMRDPLTGALNRKILELLRQIDPDSFSLILIDLDDFKTVNDRWGHAAGDKALQVLVETLVLNIRKTDYVVRLGGDEFAVILFSCDLTTAEKTAELLHRRIISRRIDHASAEFGINCSMGVGEVDSARLLDRRMEEIDQLLYIAKRTGKGRVVSDRQSELPAASMGAR